MKKPESIHTYGGEIETLAVDINTGHLMQVPKNTLTSLSQAHQANFGYDSSYHLLETNLPVSLSLVSLVEKARQVATILNTRLRQDKTSLVSTSHHPTDNILKAYTDGVLSKPIYDLLSGRRAPRFSLKDNVLPQVYGQDHKNGRGWNHPIGTMSSSIQPWNSLDFNVAPQQLAVLQATGFMFNLLTANSPFAEGEATGLRDSRLRMWGKGGMIDTSRYPQERALANNLPEKPRGYSDYFKFVLGHQRPFVVPLSVKADGADSSYKTKFMAVVQTGLGENYSVLDMMQAKTIKCIDIETGESVDVKPSLSMFFNGFDFLNFPPSARFRISLPDADSINPSIFAKAVLSGDESTVRKLLLEAGIDKGGFVCAEGRIAATVLPTQDSRGWEEFNLPYVLQTALVRAHQPVMEIIHKSGLTWKDLTVVLPKLTNSTDNGFFSETKAIKAVDLATKIWHVAKKTLTKDELALVGDQIDHILSTKTAPAERQLNYVSRRANLSNLSEGVLLDLVHHQLMV